MTVFERGQRLGGIPVDDWLFFPGKFGLKCHSLHLARAGFGFMIWYLLFTNAALPIKIHPISHKGTKAQRNNNIKTFESLCLSGKNRKL
jgi:hypothetical protein